MAQLVGKLAAGLLVHAEDARRQSADGARHPVAIEVERGEVGRAHVGRDVHVHAVDHGEEVGLAQPEVADEWLQELGTSRGLAGIQSLQIVPPMIELGRPLRPRPRAVVGDVVHQPAEAVDGIHRRTLRLGHQPHGGVEGAPRRLGLQGPIRGGVGLGRHPCLPPSLERCGRSGRISQPIATPEAPRSARLIVSGPLW